MCKEKPELHVVSFSGGKDSTTMLCGMKDRGMKIDLILYCDTSVEFPAMYEHIKQVEQYVGIPITILRAEQTFEYFLLEHKVNVRDKENHPNDKGYSFPGSRSRWCTSKLKTDVIKRFIRNLKNSYTVIQYVGIAADEKNRVKDLNYPLIDWNMTEADCLKYCYDKGFDFGGLYEIFHRVSCWCCPLQSLEELRQLRKHFPDLWKQLQEWQLKTWRKFRPDFSVQELEIRFQLEEERTKKGLSISGHNKEFRAELKRRLNKQRKDEVNMTFADKLKNLMKDLDLTQSKLSDLTGIGKSSISQYLSGKNEPSKERKQEIARALGVQETYFEMFEPAATVQYDGVVNLPVTLAAKLMKKSKEWVMQGLRDGVFPWGYAVKLTNWSYFISSVKFTEYTGIEIPWNELEAA